MGVLDVLRKLGVLRTGTYSEPVKGEFGTAKDNVGEKPEEPVEEPAGEPEEPAPPNTPVSEGQ